MPERHVEGIVHWSPELGLRVVPEERERPTYEEQVTARAIEIANEVGDVDQWPHPEHNAGECVECDAIRLLDAITYQLQDGADIDDVRLVLRGQM